MAIVGKWKDGGGCVYIGQQVGMYFAGTERMMSLDGKKLASLQGLRRSGQGTVRNGWRAVVTHGRIKGGGEKGEWEIQVRILVVILPWP